MRRTRNKEAISGRETLLGLTLVLAAAMSAGIPQLGGTGELPSATSEPSWSPDGEQIAFSSDRDGPWKLFVMNADGSDARGLLTTSTRSNDPSAPDWSPDGQFLAIRVRGEQEREGDIYLVRPDGTGKQPITSASGLDDEPAWSPDGRAIAFSSTRDGNHEIYVMAADGTGQTRLTDSPTLDGHPSWFPDGDRRAFMTNRDGRMNWEVYVMGRDGTGQMNLTSNSHWDAYPTVAPHRDAILFATIREGGHVRIREALPPGRAGRDGATRLPVRHSFLLGDHRSSAHNSSSSRRRSIPSAAISGAGAVP